MRPIKLIINVYVLCFLQVAVVAQMNPKAFPKFHASTSNPIIKYGDGFADAAWNDPCVIKAGGQYIMYVTAAKGIAISDSNTVKVYRQISSDGYHWTLSPSTPVIEPVAGTYYEGGTETPSVVIKDGMYHMYLTCMPSSRLSSDFVLAHATSADGINFKMDTSPILESDGSATIYGDLVGEPGAMVYKDSIYVFFTSAGTVSGNPVNSIGLIKSFNGTNFTAPKQAVKLPLDVYPLDSNYWGLSTPSALAINDSIYLFTDVARMINGKWTQVALHQFKTDGISGVWYHDSVPIHTKKDFNWTNGNYLSEIRSISPLLDDNGLLRIWYAGNKLANISGTDTTYTIYFDGLGKMHVDPNFWGIGTSDYQFPFITTSVETSNENFQIALYPNPANDFIFIQSSIDMKNASIKLYDITGQPLIITNDVHKGLCKLDIRDLDTGIYILRIENGQEYWQKKFTISK